MDGAVISNNSVKGNADAFVRTEGRNSKDIKLSNNKTPGIKEKIESAPAVAGSN